MNISKLSTWTASTLFMLALVVGQVWADDGLEQKPVDAKMPVTEHPDAEVMDAENMTEHNSGNVTTPAKRGGPDGKAHQTTEKTTSSSELEGLDVSTPNKSAINRVGTDEEEFVGLDLDQDGLISVSEGTGEGELKRRWIVIDKNNDHNVDKAEFREYYNARYGNSASRPRTSAERKHRFMILDKDGNGELNAEEFYTGVGAE